MFEENDMVFVKDGDKITTGGFEVDSFFLKNDVPVSYNLNENNMFGGLAVPSGLLYLSGAKPNLEGIKEQKGGVVGNELYDKLFNLAGVNSKNKLNIKRGNPSVSSANSEIDSEIDSESDVEEDREKTSAETPDNAPVETPDDTQMEDHTDNLDLGDSQESNLIETKNSVTEQKAGRATRKTRNRKRTPKRKNAKGSLRKQKQTRKL